jgi:hypothetical protein
MLYLRNHTHASQMFKQHVQDSAREEEMRSSKTLFKMSKFKNVEARTNTHNTGAGRGSNNNLRRALSYANLQGSSSSKQH